MHSKLGNSLVSLGRQEYFPGVRLRHSANSPAVFGISLRFGQGVINPWLCTCSPYNLWQVCCLKTSRIKWRGAACTPSLKASKLKNCLRQMVPGLKEFKQLFSDTKCLCLGAGRLWCQFGLPLTMVSWTFESVLLHLVHSGTTQILTYFSPWAY